MAYDLYLEVKHDDIILLNESVEQEEESLDTEELKEDHVADTEDALEETPLYFYRNPIANAVHVQVAFDPAPYNVLHAVYVRYYERTADGGAIPRSDIAEITYSRRVAKDIVEKIEDGEWEELPKQRWMGENSVIDEIQIYSLGVEE